MVKSSKFYVDIPNSWQAAPNFLGSDLTLLGEMKNKRRPIITLSNIPIGDYIFNESELLEGERKYQAHRLEWLKKNKAIPLSFIPYKNISWSGQEEVHSIGHVYKLAGLEFIEKHFFFKCNGKTFNVSTLYTQKQLSAYKKEITSILNSIRCHKN